MPSDEEEIEVFQCPACGAYVGANESRCAKCGVEFEVEMYECPSCHKEVSADDKVCPHCKAIFEEEVTEEIEEKKVEEIEKVSEKEIKETKEIEEKTEQKKEKESKETKPTKPVSKQIIEPSIIEDVVEKSKPEEKVLSASELMALMEKDKKEFESRYAKTDLTTKKLEKSVKPSPQKDKFAKREQKSDKVQVKVVKAELESIDAEYYQTSNAWKAAFLGGFIAIMLANITAAILIAMSIANVEDTQTGLLYFKYAFPLFFGIVAFTGGGYIFIYGKGNSEKTNAAASMILGLAFMIGVYVYFKKVVFVNSASAMTYYAEHKLITDIASQNAPDIGILSSSTLGFVFGLVIIACIVYGIIRPALKIQDGDEIDNENEPNKKSRRDK